MMHRSEHIEQACKAHLHIQASITNEIENIIPVTKYINKYENVSNI